MINPDAIREEFGYSVICKQCKRVFEAKRSSAEFCGGSCRAKHHRAKRKRLDAISQAKEAVRIVIENMPWEGNSIEYVALQHIRTLISGGLSNVTKE
jgi:hypothetical protein